MARDITSATNALEGVDQADRQTAVYQNLLGTVAAAANNYVAAETHFHEAIRLEPQNPAPQLNLAVIQVHGTNQQAIALGSGNALRHLKEPDELQPSLPGPAGTHS